MENVMEDISAHLQRAHMELKKCYDNVNDNNKKDALASAEEALFHVRCCILWLKERLDAPN
jgi:uncharacterized protein (UPF0332 family)